MKQDSKIKNDSVQKALTKSSFNSWYKEYKTFMELDNLPNINIIPFCNIDTPQCTVKRENNKNVLYVNQLLVLVYGQKCSKHIAFHEFTHVYDNEYLFPDIPYEKKHGYIWGYSEYHATFIEMLCALQFKSISGNQEVELTSRVYIDKSTTLKDYLLKDLHDIKITLDSYLENPTSKTMIEVLRFMFYSFAKVDFLNKYCPDALSVYNIEQLFIEKFGDRISDLHSLITNIDINNFSEFKKIFDMQVKITGDYLSSQDASD